MFLLQVSYSKGQTAMVSNEVIKGPLKVTASDIERPLSPYREIAVHQVS